MPRILHEDYSVAEYVQASPICGEDFCDLCGDCLACYSDDPCPEGGHTWVVYAEDADEWRANHVPPLG